MAFTYELETPPLGDEIVRPAPEKEVQLTQREELFRYIKVGGKTLTSMVYTAEV